MNKLRLVLFYF
uniref:Uncharacterized protein n=1 Tax=Anguilla anguilla TaxID=7936 RepID=A0A0E9XKI5_ANGAN